MEVYLGMGSYISDSHNMVTIYKYHEVYYLGLF
jgi:hypothetical protein